MVYRFDTAAKNSVRGPKTAEPDSVSANTDSEYWNGKPVVDDGGV